MTESNVRLLTILDWAEQRAAGKPCAACDRWLADSAEAAQQWEKIQTVQEHLDGGRGLSGVELLSAEQVAEYLEGRLEGAAAREVEHACWRSPAQMAELLSAVRFQQQPHVVAATANLRGRLLALTPPAPANGSPQELPVIPRLKATTVDPPAAADQLPAVAPVKWLRPTGRVFLPGWQRVAAALTVAAGLIGALLWLVSTRERPDLREERMAADPRQQPAPAPVVERARPQIDPPRTSPPEAPPPQVVESPLPEKPRRDDPSRSPDDRPARDVPPVEAIAPAPTRPLPAPQPSLEELVFDSAVGLLLLDDAGRGAWRVGRGRLAASGPIKLLSLAASFTTVEVPGLGTLVFNGSAEATLQRQPDRSWLLRLDHGRLGVRDLPMDQRLHFEVGPTAWSAQSLADASMLAVVDGPTTTSAFVAHGTVAVDGMELSQDQVTQWSGGVRQPVDSLSLVRRPASSRIVDDGLDESWLQTPSATERREWKMLHGRLAERLAEAEDVPAAMDDLFDSSRDLRHAALLARWRIAIADPERQPQLVWDALNDRREPVRRAAMHYLLELMPRDPRTVNMGRLFRVHLGDLATARIAQWLALTRTNQPLTAPVAAELGDALAADLLAVRQVAVSLLELHTQPVLRRARLNPPAFDAAAPMARRAAAQREWLQIIRRLYASRAAAGVRAAQPAAPQGVP
jgi:hypothetical protein